MTPRTAVATWGAVGRLDPAVHPDCAAAVDVALADGTYAKGTVLGEVAATPGKYAPYSRAVVAAPAAAVLSDGGAAGTFGAGTWHGQVTFTNANGETTPSADATTVLIASHKLHFAAITLPTGATGVNYYSGATAGSTTMRLLGSGDGTAIDFAAPPSAGTSQTPATNTCIAALDGTKDARGILAYDCVALGGNLTVEGEFGQNRRVVPLWIAGVFACEALTGLDATAVTALGRLIQGNTTTGLFLI